MTWSKEYEQEDENMKTDDMRVSLKEQVVQNQTESTDGGSLTTRTTSFLSEKHKSTLFYCETSPVSFTCRRALLRCHDGVGEDGQEQRLKPVGVPPRSAPRTKGQITFGRA